MFKILPDKLNIPFMAMRVPAVIFSLLAVIASVMLFFSKGLNYGVDFAGGIQMVLRFAPDVQVNAESLRASFSRLGLNDASVQNFGTQFDDVAGDVTGEKKEAREFMVHFSSEFVDADANQELLRSAFAQFNSADGEETLVRFRFSGLERAFFSVNRDIPFSEVEQTVKGITFKLLQLESVQAFGPERNREYELKFRDVSSKLLDRLRQDFTSALGAPPVTLEKVDFVGAKVGSDLKVAAIWSTIIALFLIFLYIFMRFDFTFAPGAVAATAHDVIVTVGVFSLLDLDFDLTAVAALLTLAGYSVNDTIVIYDRIRELMAEYRGKAMREIIDLALNQTLSRTIITSLTFLMASGVLWVFGGPVIHSFAFALTFGVLVGSYSTIFIASVMVLWIHNWQAKRGSGRTKAAAA